MQDSDTPAKLYRPFAHSAAGPYITAIPLTSQVGITEGAASLADGFPPLTFVPIDAGGAGPRGQDFNGILYSISAGVRWHQAGGPIFHDPAFSSTNGGYPKGTVLHADSVVGESWISTVENNTTDPDAGGAGWRGIFQTEPYQLLFIRVVAGVALFTVPNGRFRLFGRCSGGGGAGASNKTTASGGAGAAGGHVFGWFDVTPGEIITITVGANGVAVAVPDPTNGNGGGNGSSSSIGAYMTATGGGGGSVTANSAGGTTIPPAFTGGDGGWNGGAGSDGSTEVLSPGGQGGASYYGGGGRSSTIGSVEYYSPGSGGGGGYGAGSVSGGDGGVGIVEIWG